MNYRTFIIFFLLLNLCIKVHSDTTVSVSDNLKKDNKSIPDTNNITYINSDNFDNNQNKNPNKSHQNTPTKSKFGSYIFLGVDFVFKDFNEFEPILGAYNIDLMNKPNGIYNFEFAGIYNNYYAGINYGYNDDSDNDHDSLDLEFNTLQFGLHFGYNIINSKRLLITPKVAIKWNRYRLINSDNNNRISLNQYLLERDLDIRFNQLTGFIGMNFSFKLYDFNPMSSDYWTIGAYGGYAFKINNNTWIYSKKNRLTTNNNIDVKCYNIGFYISYNYE